jgi:transcriptional regulator with XRE-family HTH domain
VFFPVFFCFFRFFYINLRTSAEPRGGWQMLDQALLEEVLLFMEQPEQQRTRRVPPSKQELMRLMLHPAFQLPEPSVQPALSKPPQEPPAPADDLPAGFWRLTQVIEQLRQERAARGLSLDWLRKESGISRGRLSMLENRVEVNPTINTLERIAEALGVRLLVKVERTREVGAPLTLRQLLQRPPAFAAKIAAGEKQSGSNSKVDERDQAESVSISNVTSSQHFRDIDHKPDPSK